MKTMIKMIKKLTLTLAALAVVLAVGCGGEPQDDVQPHILVDVQTGVPIAQYVDHGEYELIPARLLREDLERLFKQASWKIVLQQDAPPAGQSLAAPPVGERFERNERRLQRAD
jgi:hypothetical protein